MQQTALKETTQIIKRWLIGGQVQGVGFRPFVFRLAQQFHLDGWVCNCIGGVEVVAQGESHNIERFGHAILNQSRTFANPVEIESQAVADETIITAIGTFHIKENSNTDIGNQSIPVDHAICSHCLHDLHTLDDRRYHYPFISCSQCGPRYSLIKALPYGREETTLSDFPLCETCQNEYKDPSNHRFHAETIGCADCGPRISFCTVADEQVYRNEQALQRSIQALRDGNIIAVKGIGGYHLLCDARNRKAIARLRTRKHRPHKPLAVLFQNDISLIKKQFELDNVTTQILQHPAAPIVLLQKKTESNLAGNIAPGLNYIGVMLAYSPLHELIATGFGGPLIATSGNISGEPVIIDNNEAQKKLGHVTDGFLHHNRNILHPADDSVFSIIAERARPVRIGRGYAPLELQLPFTLPFPILALGSQQKNTITLAWENRAIISPHIGNLDSPGSLTTFRNNITEFQRLYGVKPKAIVHDSHPGFGYQAWLNKQKTDSIPVLHHYAHASALAGEHHIDAEMLVFTWDGLGLGNNNQLWGGETLIGRPGQWQRIGSFKPWRLVSGNQAAKEPWRSAASLHWSLNRAWERHDPDGVLHHAWLHNINCHETTSAGRLFDAAAAILEIVDHSSFDGQAPMWLEACAVGRGDITDIPIQEHNNGLWHCDWTALIAMLNNTAISTHQRAANFHSSLANCLLQQSLLARREYGMTHIGLTGGVFQNKRLTEECLMLLNKNGFNVLLHECLPCNDGNISFGQIIEAGKKLL